MRQREACVLPHLGLVGTHVVDCRSVAGRAARADRVVHVSVSFVCGLFGGGSLRCAWALPRGTLNHLTLSIKDMQAAAGRLVGCGRLNGNKAAETASWRRVASCRPIVRACRRGCKRNGRTAGRPARAPTLTALRWSRPRSPARCGVREVARHAQDDRERRYIGPEMCNVGC